MSMKVKNNLSAVSALNRLDKNTKEAASSLKKLSSGTKITGAGENSASEYAISAKMLTCIRALGQDEQNVKSGNALLNIAAGGIENIVNELRNLKELALNSANDHNTDDDRATLQKEFDQRIANINDIAATTNYNGKILLDGRYFHKRVPNIAKPMPVSEPQTIGSDYILADGTYVLPEGYSGTVIIGNVAKNVLIKQANPGEALHDVYILAPTYGDANIWIENLNIENYLDGSIIKFGGADNYLTILGENNIHYVGDLNYNKAVVNMGDGLTLQGTGSLNITNNGTKTCAAIGVDEDQHTTGSITITSGTYNLVNARDGGGIGSSVRSSMGDINIYGGSIKAVAYEGAGIGSTCYPEHYPFAESSVGNITIGREAKVEAESFYGAGIGSGAFQATAGNIKISKYAEVSAKSVLGENIGKGYLGIAGNIIIDWDDRRADYPGYVWQGNPLVIQHGTAANVSLNVYINDMRTNALGLTDTKLTTREAAKAAISRIDYAIDYALDEATNVGAYGARLKYTAANLTIAGENTIAAESAIRDADMAREMTTFTKNNVLAQASQSMLAQANQNASGVLSLLQ